MPNVSNYPRKKRQYSSASSLAFFRYLHPAKIFYDRHPNKEKHYALGAIIITQRYVIRVTRREQIYIFMKHKAFRDHELQCVHKWVRVTRECSEAHAFEDSEEK